MSQGIWLGILTVLGRVIPAIASYVEKKKAPPHIDPPADHAADIEAEMRDRIARGETTAKTPPSGTSPNKG